MTATLPTALPTPTTVTQVTTVTRVVHRGGRDWTVLGAALAVLLAANLLNNHLAVPAYVVTSVTATVLLLVLHRVAGGTWEQAGLGRRGLARGARWALGLALVVAAGYLLVAVLPATRALLVDPRVDPATAATVAYQVGIRIALGTVLLEEVAFRGVLPALVARRWGVAWAGVASCALFALWHVSPGLHLAQASTAQSGGMVVLIVVVALAGSALAGLVLLWLRRRSGSLLAPIGLHWAVNALGYLAVVLVHGAG